MGHRPWRLGLLLAGLAQIDTTVAPAQETSPEVASILASGTHDLQGVPTYVIQSIEEQASVLRALNVEPLSRTLVFAEDGTPYDVVETSGGTVRFDISALLEDNP